MDVEHHQKEYKKNWIPNANNPSVQLSTHPYALLMGCYISLHLPNSNMEKGTKT
jgi:hypothetical protein